MEVLVKAVAFVVQAAAVVIFIAWVVRRVRRRRPPGTPSQGYSPAQVFGMLGIVLVLAPALFVAAAAPVRLVFGGVLALLESLNFGTGVWRSIELTMGVVATVITFAATFFVCELIWPKRADG